MHSFWLILIFLISLIAANGETYTVAKSLYVGYLADARSVPAPHAHTDARSAILKSESILAESATPSTAEFLVAVLSVGLLPTSLKVTENTVSSRFIDDHAQKRQLDWHLAGAVALVLALIYSIYLHPLLS